MLTEQQVDQYGQLLWHDLTLYSPLAPASCIIVMGSIDVRTAQRAAELMLQGLAPYVVFSGNCGRNTEGLFNKTEAEVFAEVAHRAGVPGSRILLETRATNTGENVKFSMALLAERGIDVDSVILVHKDFATKRAFATFKQHFPDIDARVTGPQLTYTSYPNDIIDKPLFIHTLVGDMQRMKLYPALGYQLAMPIDSEAWRAYQALVAAGFTEQVIP
ncbi:YdcF family protein [Motilimonas cestriensis]|uniref:YdcF family protein n=1 Tax=Motilimonas cestriensis TaxID=2742685 RepID=A0ABS8WDF1_9GAMM|nr:YdcF family protein [Motilimonas cestriensis]MCE2596295.1 YdcF family protein [Motilimonas cestriensis]